MALTEREQAFLKERRTAAMVTLRADGTPHVVRVGAALVDGRIWSSGTRDRVRTRHVRRDPRSTLFVFEDGFRWIALDSTVTILDGPDAPELNLRLFQEMQLGMDPGPTPGHIIWEGRERSIDDFLRIMVEEQRLIYQFEVIRARGVY